jgi:hypothetical protein
MKYPPNKIPNIDMLGLYSTTVKSNKGNVYFSLLTYQWHKALKDESDPATEIKWWRYPEPKDISEFPKTRNEL